MSRVETHDPRVCACEFHTWARRDAEVCTDLGHTFSVEHEDGSVSCVVCGESS